METAIVHIDGGSPFHQFVKFVEGGVRSKRNIGGGRNHNRDIHTSFDGALKRLVDGGCGHKIRVDNVHIFLCRIDRHGISMTEHTAVFLRCAVYDGDDYIGGVRLLLVLGEVCFAANVLFSLLVPYGKKYFLQVIDGIAFYSHVHITPCADFRESVDVVVGDVHSSRIGDFAVDDGYFAVITVCRMIDVGKGERVELDNLDSLLPYFFEMSLLERFIVRPVAERIKHGPYFHAFFHLFGQQIEKRIGYRVIAEIEVFQMNVVFGVADGAE